MSWQEYRAGEYRYYGGPPQPPQTSGTATAALVLGICGFFVCPLICSIAAIICGNIALNEIDRSGGRVTGRDMAKAGLILGWVGVALCVLAILAIAAFIVWAASTEGDVDYYYDTQISMIRVALNV
ncbi:DUF4190 domain-containing protein [Solirubrobacter phytolaccae]|uniref:DUF4190 domain-containing protein n=1 Tax=Solirubrobacter phytolaccae TaxID=1404360 RepID=A0A9X3NET9_9ACTN|nr:DUF4190 domain-containing protein [Solirubrobacter phytolaccae]MDA0184726.1 DUF4190 domain-containing protein [Solirubrobacter phytolaccae]